MPTARAGAPANLLIVFDGALAAPFLFDKAAALAGPQTRVHVVQVIHEGVAELSVGAIEDSTRLKSFILESAESLLEDQVDAYRDRFASLECATLWNARAWEGVLHAADRVEADLILKAASTPGGVADRMASVVRTPDDWNLLRHSTVPVLLAKPVAWGAEEPVILCALDVFDDRHVDLNGALVAEALSFAERLGGVVDLVVAYPLFEPWVGELGAVKSYAEIKAAVEEDVRVRIGELADATAYRHLHLEEGHTAEVLARLVGTTDAALLVLGTHAREGVRGVLLGNTSERILHVVDCDVVTVHAP